jgi:hypothetical protein
MAGNELRLAPAFQRGNNNGKEKPLPQIISNVTIAVPTKQLVRGTRELFLIPLAEHRLD